MRRVIPRAPSRRAVRNQLQALSALANGTTPVFEKPTARSAPRGKQKEAAFEKLIGQWGQTKGGELYKNRRGMVTLPGGGMFPYGWGPNGTLDRLGWLPVRITPEMVGMVLPIFTEIESKTADGSLQENQQQRIEFLRDHKAIAGVAWGEQTVDDCERILAAWRDGYGH